jgi:hypothetical protein
MPYFVQYLTLLVLTVTLLELPVRPSILKFFFTMIYCIQTCMQYIFLNSLTLYGTGTVHKA